MNDNINPAHVRYSGDRKVFPDRREVESKVRRKKPGQVQGPFIILRYLDGTTSHKGILGWEQSELVAPFSTMTKTLLRQMRLQSCPDLEQTYSVEEQFEMVDDLVAQMEDAPMPDYIWTYKPPGGVGDYGASRLKTIHFYDEAVV